MISWETILLRLALAAILGAIVGLERERKDEPAGMRTHMMVCVGSALTIIVSSFGFSDILGTPNVVLDPSRIAAQVISGIGFLGAGIIIFLRPGFIRGLTTASGLWTVAAIGLAAGAGMYFAAVIATAIAIIILLLLKPFEKRFIRRFNQKSVRISIDFATDPITILNYFLEQAKMDIDAFTFDKNKNNYTIEIKFTKFDAMKMMPLLLEVEKQQGVREVYWSK